ncbi:anthranilate synthase family protein (plasmid) [Coraliomargarita sp. W4R53]
MTGYTPSSLQELAAAGTPFALIARDDSTVELLLGEVIDVELLADIPLTDSLGVHREVLALVPFRQVRERGFECHDDGAPLRCLVVSEHIYLDRSAVIDALPAEAVPLDEPGFDIADDDYADIVRRVISDEIGQGEGANFVIRRDFVAGVSMDAATAALTWFKALLEHERGAYWTFAIVTPGHIAVGASPEAHVSAKSGVVTMNPISGTFRHPVGGATAATLTEFLESTKETEELFMVVDEELKMMSAVCSDGGRITGPQLKVMSRLTHTEYMLRGTSKLDPRDILRETMFAPTVTGSPMQNACTVITRHERTARGYYSGVAALFTPRDGDSDSDGGATHDLDAPILIRTAYLQSGRLRVPVGATLVRHSDPYGEVNETHGKAAGVLGAIGAIARDTVAEVQSLDAIDEDAPAPPRLELAQDATIRALLESRNSRLAAFWLNPQGRDGAGEFDGRRALVVDAEDRFTTMLAHQLRHLGLDVDIVPWNAVTDQQIDNAELVVAGPGPGDPRDSHNDRMIRMREVVGRRRAAKTPILAVCLSHQILADSLGIELAPLETPHQGLQKSVDIFGMPASIGFYNTFTAHVAPGTARVGEADIAADASGAVYALRGPGFASVQGHLESILSRDGMTTLERLVTQALKPANA